MEKALRPQRRPPRNEKAVEISQPEFLYTDAAPRNDLYALPRIRDARESTDQPWFPSSNGPSFVMNHKYPPSRARRSYNDNFEPVGTESQVLPDAIPDNLGIGAAVGSPSHSTWTNRHRDNARTSEVSVIASTPPGSATGYYEPTVDDIKHKGKWRIFGGLFSKKGLSNPNSPASPFYSVIPNSTKRNLAQASTPTSPPQNHESKMHRSLNSGTLPQPWGRSSTDTHWPGHGGTKPSISRSYTSPYDSGLAKSPTPPPKDPSHPLRTTSAVPRLHIDIPDVKMERYSVMFGHVLEKPQSSIMVRRQQQVEKLKVISDFDSYETEHSRAPGPRVRRATLPSPAKSSPSYSLFPIPSQPEKRPSPLSSSTRPPHSLLQRSNTALAVSPARGKFEVIPPKVDTSNIVFSIDSPSPSTESPETPEQPWTSDLPHHRPNNLQLDDNEISPRNEEDIVIKFEPVLSQKYLRIKGPPFILQESKARQQSSQHLKSRRAPDLRSRYNTQPLVATKTQKRVSSPINKPNFELLATPQRLVERDTHETRQKTRNASLPAPLVRTIDIATRKTSLPAQSSLSLQPRHSRNTSLQHPIHEPTDIRTPRSTSLQTTEQSDRTKALSHRNQAPPNTRESSQNPASQTSMQCEVSHDPNAKYKEFQPATAITTAWNSSTYQRPSVSKPTHSNPLKSAPTSAAEISIARQISISRRQQLMIPIVPKTVRQPQQATLVVPGEGKGEVGDWVHISRKSQHGLVENA